jgi:hypothetical protein
MLHGDGHPGEAELSRLDEDVLRELAGLIDPGGPRAHDLLGEVPNAGLKESLVLGKLEIHDAGEYTGKVGSRQSTVDGQAVVMNAHYRTSGREAMKERIFSA